MNTTQRTQRLISGAFVVLAIGGLAACAGRSVDGDGAGAAHEIAQSRALERSAAEAYVDQLETWGRANEGRAVARMQADAYVTMLESRAYAVAADAGPLG